MENYMQIIPPEFEPSIEEYYQHSDGADLSTLSCQKSNTMFRMEKTMMPIELYQYLLMQKKEMIDDYWDSSEILHKLYEAIDRVLVTYDINAVNPCTKLTLLDYAFIYKHDSLVGELLRFGAVIGSDKHNEKYEKQQKLLEKPTALLEDDYFSRKTISQDLSDALNVIYALKPEELIKKVMISGDVDFLDINGETLLMLFASMDFDKLFNCSIRSLDVMAMLICNGADVNIRNVDGQSALSFCNSVDKQQLLINVGINYTADELNDINWFIEDPIEEQIGSR